ncbi:MAG: putative sulfate exporter family transporter, partial [Campylobacterota bacterium]|nr:putative sulfate exporter family transporter [Campylobacterota bacterium]
MIYQPNILGLTLSFTIAAIALFLAPFFPVGAVVIAILLGILIGNSVALKDTFTPGINYAQKSILAFAIALMGIDLDFSILIQLGNKTLVLIVLGMVLTIGTAIVLGRIFKIDTKLALLLGIGNGVCGSSAIGATAPIIKANKDFIALSVAVVNLLGTIGIFLVPFLAILFGLDHIDAGILVGNTLQAVGQVTAGGFSISDSAGISATAVKMGRVLLLTPLVFILIFLFHREKKELESGAKIPLFIIFFILFSLLSSFSLVNESTKELISTLSHLSLVVAMSAIGLSIHFS